MKRFWLQRIGLKSRIPIASAVHRVLRRHLSKRIREHMPAWLSSGETRTISSAILGHLADTHHPANQNAFRVIHRVPLCLPKPARLKTLCTAEAIGMRLFNPILCNQKRFVQALRLRCPPIDRYLNQSASDYRSTIAPD